MRRTPAVLLALIIAATFTPDARAFAFGWPTSTATRPPIGPTATQTSTPPQTSTPTRTATSTGTRTGTPTNTPTIPALSDAFQLRYAANLTVGDSFVNMTNAGTAGAEPVGNICANVYVFAPDETMVACCSCPITPNGLRSFSAISDLVNNPLTPPMPMSIVVKLLATTKTAAACNASSPTSANLAPGLRAWGTTIHALPTSPVTYGVTETEFSQAVLSGSELAQLTSTCASIQATGAGFGICRSCQLGGH